MFSAGKELLDGLFTIVMGPVDGFLAGASHSNSPSGSIFHYLRQRSHRVCQYACNIVIMTIHYFTIRSTAIRVWVRWTAAFIRQYAAFNSTESESVPFV